MSDQYEEIKISTPYITLGQFIKLTNIFDSGGMIKSFLADHGVIVNNEIEHRRGRKLYINDVVQIEDMGVFKVTEENKT